MTAIASISALQTALLKSNAKQILPWHKPTSAGTTTDVPYFPARIAGASMPPQLAIPSAGLGSAVACNSSTVGAMPLCNAPASTVNFLFKTLWNRSNATQVGGGVLLVDRLAHFTVDINTATAAVSPALDATARLAAGEGGMIMVQVTSALSAASNTITLGYTNQAGTAGRTTGVITTVASRAIDLAAYASAVFVPLQAGDTGVRSIEDWTLTGGAATGTVVVSIVKPLALSGAGVYCDVVEKELLVQLPKFVTIPDNACLEYIVISNATSSALFDGALEIFNN